MKGSKRLVFLFAMTAWLAVGCSPMVPPSTGTQKEVAPAPAKPAPYTGVKKRIAVAKFDAVGTYAGDFTGSDIGGGVAAQLTTALVESGRFVVVERAALSEIQREQELGAQRLAPQGTAAQVGNLLDAQMLVVGSVTEFEQAAKGGGMDMGLSGPLAGIGLGGKSVEGHVGMDIRLVDTTTGQVVTSKRVEARVPSRDVSLKITTLQGVEFGGDAFNKTPLGQATRSAIEEAVALIVGEMETVPWAGRVADLLGGQVLVNAGRDMNLQPGTIFIVSSVVKEVTDPATGARLGVIEAPLGEIQIEQVQEKFSTARLLTGTLPKRGDLLRLKH
jgi:curli biogenesis system outer membrane secretion channel CsgG